MKNVAKFEETRKAVKTFKEKTEYLFEDAEEKKDKKGIDSKVYQKAFFKALQTSELFIDEKKRLVSFESPFGCYIQPIYVKKRRINVVPLCFLVELYKAGIKDIPEAKASEIPFTLRGFWKQDKTIDCVTELFKLATRSILSLSTYLNYKQIQDCQKKEINDLINVIKEFQVLPTKYDKKYPYTEVIYMDEKFIINNTNIKANVVPLCKMICRYYCAVMYSISECMITLNKDNKKLENVKDEFLKFSQKYFVPTKFI